MKKIKLQTVMALLLLIANFSYAQTTYTVDNNPGAPADFANLQDAIDAAASGDTLLVQGSTSGYGNVILNKPLTLIGPGYYLDQNTNTQEYKASVTIGSFNVYYGAEGAHIFGFGINSFIVDSCDNVVVSNNKINGTLRIYYSNSIMIKNNLVYGNYYMYGRYVSIFLDDVCSNLVFKSNYIIAGFWLSNGASTASVSLISNVLNTTPPGDAEAVYNNIVRYGNPIINTPSVHHNIFSSGNSANNGNNNNLYGVDMTTVFIDNTDPRYSDDGRYILKAGSPAQGAGSGGVDCGMFGGGYKLSGIPVIPNIYMFTAPETGYTNDGGIQIHVEVKSNN